MTVVIEQFMQSLRDSGLLSAQEIDSFLSSLPEQERPKTGEDMAKLLVRRQKLTKFQAQAIYQGKTRGLLVGNYLVLEKLGQGGMGYVYKARHRKMQRTVALKVLPFGVAKDIEAVQRFQREVVAAAQLTHPNIVTAYDADEADGMHFLVMEYVEGKDLGAVVRDRGPLPVPKAVDYIIQAARGLEFAHKRRVIHRDIKPANLLLDKAGTVKILDTGLARFEQKTGGYESTAAAALTQTGQVMGTIDYMPPEQALDTHTADERSDQYGLGCTLFYLLTGRPVYGGETILKKMMAHREEPIPSLPACRQDVPKELDAVFQKMVAKQAKERYRSMQEVIAALDACRNLKVQRATETISLEAGPTGGGDTEKPPPLPVAPSSDSGTGSPGIEDWLNAELPVMPAMVRPRPARRPKLEQQHILIGSVVAGVALVLVLLGIVLKYRTSDGTSVVTAEQADAEVTADGDKVTIASRGEAEPPEPPARPRDGPLPVDATSRPGKWIQLASSPEDLMKWDRSGATYSFRDGELTLKSGRLVYPTSMRDVILHTYVKNVSAHRFMVGVRYDTPLGSYLGWLNQNKWFGVGKLVGKQFIEREQVAAIAPRADWIDLSLAAVGDVVSLHLDRQKIVSVRDSGLASGGLCLETCNGEVVFKDIRVQEVDAKALGDGDPLTTCSQTGKWIIAMAADALANPSAIPVTGEIHEELLPLDAIMLEQVREKRCTSAILAVERNGAILACRGYGWQDRQATRPINPFARMRPVGLGHVFARAAASMMVRNGKVALETKILNYLGFGDSPMSVPDSRAFKITVRDAIEERLGWDEEHRLDAVWKQMDASARSRLLTVNDFIARMVKQPLQFEPGEKAIADCFGDILLRGVVEKAAEKEFAAALKDVFEECGPTHLGPSLPEDRAGDEEVCYGPPTNNEPPFALFHRQLAMSAVDLSRFARYWGGGDKWSGGRANWVGFWWWSYSELAIQYNVWADGAICVQMFNGQVDCNEVAGRLRKVLDERADRCFLTHASSSPAPTANATSNTSPSPR